MSNIINPHRFAAAVDEGGVVWDILKWRCFKGKPSWDLDATRFLGMPSEVNHTITDGYGEGTHYAEFLISDNDSITGAGVVSPEWFTGTCSSDDAGATPTSSLNSYMTDQAAGTWKTHEAINIPGMGGEGDTVSVDETSVSNRIGIEVDVVGGMNGSEVRFYEVQSNGTRTLVGEVDYMNDGVDFSATTPARASFAASSYAGPTTQIYSNSADWWGTPTSGYVVMTSD